MNVTEVPSDPYPFENFAPTLSQCFVITIVGYLLAKLEILSAGDVKGVVSFASYFAIPGFISVSLADADFSDFQWELLIYVLLGKFLTFVVVAGFLVFLRGNVGVAGAVALFCVQSNDLPVGCPLMAFLYKNHRPQMMKYLLLIPAMTVTVFVPISNIMIKIYKEKQSQPTGDPRFRDMLWHLIQIKNLFKQLQAVLKTPAVVATILGLVLNFIFKGTLPGVLHQPIKVAAATIPGIALVLLGFSFVRKERYLLSSAVVPAMILFALKMIFTPLLLDAIVNVLAGDSKSSKLQSDFVLFYGIISPATAVFQTEREFRKPLAVMSVALILSSFVCFPLSFVVARLTVVPAPRLSTYDPILKHLLFWTACISIFCDVTVCFNISLKKRCRKHFGIIFLAFVQIISGCGVLLWSFKMDKMWIAYCEMALCFGGELAGYICTGTLAVALIFRERHRILVGKSRIVIFLTVFSVSIAIAAVVCVLMFYSDVQRVYVIGHALFSFDLLQLTVSSTVLFINLAVVAVCLTYHFKRKKLKGESMETSAFENDIFYIQEQEELAKRKNSERVPENLRQKDEVKNCYHEVVVHTHAVNNNLSSEVREWTFQLSSLLILLELVMIVRFICNLFKLFRSQCLEVMIPLEFLQSTLFTGQGIFMLLTFGIDARTFIIQLRKWWRKMRHGSDDFQLKIKNEDKKGDVPQACTQFYNFYYSQCFRDIAKDRRWKSEVYEDSFWGHQLVDWLITEGICSDDADAEAYGQKLMTGGVIQHVDQKHYFYDAPYLYQFRNKK